MVTDETLVSVDVITVWYEYIKVVIYHSDIPLRSTAEGHIDIIIAIAVEYLRDMNKCSLAIHRFDNARQIPILS